MAIKMGAPIPTTENITEFVTGSMVDAGKFLIPTMIGGAFLGKIGVIVGAIGGAAWISKNKASKPAAAAVLTLVAIDTFAELAFGKDVLPGI